MTGVLPYAKAIVGALVAGLGALGTALTDGAVSAQEWVAVASATLVALGVVFGVPNRDPQAAHQDESVQPPEAGAGELGFIINVLLIVLLIFAVVFFAQRI